MSATKHCGSIQQAFQTKISLNNQQYLHWLVKAEILQTLKYPSMLKAVEMMECSQLQRVQHGDNAKYTSRQVTQELLQITG